MKCECGELFLPVDNKQKKCFPCLLLEEYKKNKDIINSFETIDCNLSKIEKVFSKHNIIDKNPIYTIMSAIKNIKIELKKEGLI